MTLDPKKTALLLAALPDVPFDGWSDALIARAAKKSDMTETAARKLFPKGAKDLVLFFSEWADAEMMKKLTPSKIEKLRVSEKVTLGVRARLEALTKHKEAARAALSYMALPPRSFFLPKLVWDTADKIWLAAGDTATDYNRYTKRLLLAGVLTSTAAYWLNDTSPAHEKTWIFLDRRIENVLSLGRKISSFRKKA